MWVWTCECGCGGAILTLHAFCVCADLCVLWCEIMRCTAAHFQRGRVHVFALCCINNWYIFGKVTIPNVPRDTKL